MYKNLDVNPEVKTTPTLTPEQKAEVKAFCLVTKTTNLHDFVAAWGNAKKGFSIDGALAQPILDEFEQEALEAKSKVQADQPLTGNLSVFAGKFVKVQAIEIKE